MQYHIIISLYLAPLSFLYIHWEIFFKTQLPSNSLCNAIRIWYYIHPFYYIQKISFFSFTLTSIARSLLNISQSYKQIALDLFSSSREWRNIDNKLLQISPIRILLNNEQQWLAQIRTFLAGLDPICVI